VGQDFNHISYVRGDREFKERRYADAAKYFMAALDDWPEDWMAMHALANCYSEMKKPRKTERWFRLAIDIAPPENRVKLTYNLGNALFDQQRYEEAIQIYRNVPRGHELWRLAAINIAASEKQLGVST
jgi:tetratricopeptide (TPR) repeat protein